MDENNQDENNQDENNPPLSENKKKFLNRLKSITNNAIDRATGNLPEDDETADEIIIRLTIIEDNLSIICKQLLKARRSRRKFLHDFKEWHPNREESVKNLRKIAESMKDKKFWFNVSKVVSTATSVIGGTATLLAPVTGGVSLAAGNVISGVGVAASACATASEIKCLKDDISKVQEILVKDKEFFLKLTDWLNHVAELDTALSEILEMNIAKQMLGSVKNLVQRALEMQNEDEQLLYIRERIRDIVGRFATGKVPEYFILVLTVALATICVFISENNHRHTFASVLLVGKGSLDVIRLILHITGFSVSRQVFNWITGVGIVVDSAVFALAAIDLCNGSPCPEAEKILEVAESLEKEAKNLLEVYNETKTIDIY